MAVESNTIAKMNVYFFVKTFFIFFTYIFYIFFNAGGLTLLLNANQLAIILLYLHPLDLVRTSRLFVYGV